LTSGAFCADIDSPRRFLYDESGGKKPHTFDKDKAMIYLDYTANTPVHDEVLRVFTDVTREFIANPNAAHSAGKAARERLERCSENIARLLGLTGHDIVYTSGATESNNLAILGAATERRGRGRHVVSTFLEHSSVNGPLAKLGSEGFDVEYVPSLPDGTLDLDALSDALTPETTLASVCYVDSELGAAQDISAIAELVRRIPGCLLHVDATQAVGKIPLELDKADLVSLAPHKFYGLVGSGILAVRRGVSLEVQMHGGLSTTPHRSGTPTLALAAAAEKALELALDNLDEKRRIVSEHNARLRAHFMKDKRIAVNSAEKCVPHILNISLPGLSSEDLKNRLDERGVLLSTRSACCAPNTVSRPVYAVTGNKKRALSTLRVSLSHLTTTEEILQFIEIFDDCLKALAP
jgi:cysteine desulfurase